jgi:acetylornithine deacetylase
MSLDTRLERTILAAVDDDRAVAWLREAIATPSITGSEMAFAGLVAAELEACGADEVHLEEVEPGRPIVWSVIRGSGDGPSLMLAGHLDTVRVDGWAERWAGTEREDPFGAIVVNGAVWGRGASDLKGGIAAAIGAVRTIHAARARLRGDLVTLWICDEESGEPGMGRSIGMHGAIQRLGAGRIPHSDFAIYVEPTSLAVYTAQIGFLIAEIELHGRSAYFGRPEEGVDALRAGHRVLSELWRLGDELPGRDEHRLLGRPALLVTGVRSGGYIAVPGDCSISLIRTLVPSEDLGAAAAEIEAAVARGVEGTGVRATVAFPAGRDHEVGGLPAETDARAQRRVEALLHALGTAAPERPQRIAGAPFWSEMSFLDDAGIACVYWAPGDIANAHTAEEHVMVDELLDAVRALSLFIADHCGVGAIEGGVA